MPNHFHISTRQAGCQNAIRTSEKDLEMEQKLASLSQKKNPLLSFARDSISLLLSVTPYSTASCQLGLKVGTSSRFAFNFFRIS